MEDQDKVELEYLKGFNEGYLIAQHMPELAEKLANIETDFIRAVAFKEGYQQYNKEKTRERLPSWLKGDRPKAKDSNTPEQTKGRDLEPDKD